MATPSPKPFKFPSIEKVKAGVKPAAKPKPKNPSGKNVTQANRPLTQVERRLYEARMGRDQRSPSKSKTTESPLKPTNRPTSSKNWRPDTPGGLNTGSNAVTGSGMLQQKETKWVGKTGKQGGKLVYRQGPKQDQPVTGNVRIQTPGTTYPSRTNHVGPKNAGRNTGGTYNEALYVAGRNVNSPASKAQAAKTKAARNAEALKRITKKGK